MKIWLDDIRPMPDGFDVHVRTADEAIELLGGINVSFISLDHDLGDETAGTGYDVAQFIEKGAYLGIVPPMGWQVHSANPVGRNNIISAMRNAEKYWGVT